MNLFHQFGWTAIEIPNRQLAMNAPVTIILSSKVIVFDDFARIMMSVSAAATIERGIYGKIVFAFLKSIS
jgi:hypothetical protein